MFRRSAPYHPYKSPARPSPAGFRLGDLFPIGQYFNLFGDFATTRSPDPSPLSSPVRGSHPPKDGDDAPPTFRLADLFTAGFMSPQRPSTPSSAPRKTNAAPPPKQMFPTRRKSRRSHKSLSFKKGIHCSRVVPPHRRSQVLENRREALCKKLHEDHERRMVMADEAITRLRQEAETVMKPEYMTEEDRIFLEELGKLEVDQIMDHDLERCRDRMDCAEEETEERRKAHETRDAKARKLRAEMGDEEAREEQKKKVEEFVRQSNKSWEARLRRAEEEAIRADERRQRAHLAAERKVREEQERLFREEQLRKTKQEERLKREEQARRRRDEAERIREAQRLRRERRLREEVERLRQEAQERLIREDQQRKLREEAERLRREAQERLIREDQQRKLREEAERLRREAQEHKLREEAERLRREAQEHKLREEAERLRREAQEHKLREEAERLRREAQERKLQEEVERMRREARERELREEVERLHREAQERRLREEQERLLREQQERLAREEREREARQRAEQARHVSEEEQVRQHFMIYERKWHELRTSNNLPPIDVQEMPWPIFGVIFSADQITHQAVQTFLFHSLRPGVEGKTTRDKVKSEVLRFHPDKFNTRIVPKIKEAQQAVAKEIAGAIARILTTIMTETVEQNR